MLSFFSRDVLDEILDLIESVSVGVSHLLMSCESHRQAYVCNISAVKIHVFIFLREIIL